MKHNISIAVAALAVAFGGCNARPGSDRNAEKVTVAGCVQSAEQGLGSSNDKSDVDRFMLTNASVASTASASSAAAPGDQARSDPARSDAAATPATPPTGTMYLLDGKKSELREYLNQQVEVTGRVDHDQAKRSSAPPDERQQLHVESIRMIAANCNR
jgi:hypothetical protein